MRRVVVTGLGLATPLGDSPAALADALAHGRSGLKTIELEAGSERLATLAGVAADPDDLDPKLLRRSDRFVHLALAAAQRAYADAGTPNDVPDASGVLMGVGFGGIASFCVQYDLMRERGPHRVSPLFVPLVIANMAAGHIAERLGWRGVNHTYSNACAAGASAIGEAFLKIQSGQLEVAAAGGAEAPLVGAAVAGFANMRALAKPGVGAKPFAADRAGFVLGEGAAVLILEEFERARYRKARIYAELSGYGTSADAYHITDPDPAGAGAEQAVRQALAAAGLSGSDLDYVNAHATGTPLGDAAEAAMLARVLGPEGLARTWVSSTKGLSGHLLGAAGALEAAITVQTIQTGILPPNLPLGTPDPNICLRLVRKPGMQQPVAAALSNSFGFGGVNVALVFTAPDLHIDSKSKRRP